MRFRLVFYLFLLVCSTAYAQHTEDNLIKEWLQNMADDLPEDLDLSEIEERLIYLNKHPINLNHTTAEELKSLFFLSPLQIGNLLAHLEINGKLIDLYELQSVATFNLQTVERLLPFVTLKEGDLIDKINFRNLAKLGQHDLVIRGARTIEKLKGFTSLTGSRYLGSPERFLWRYKYNYSNRVTASLLLEKDAGEKLISGTKNAVFDYQSAHVGIYQLGKFKKIILGDYTLQFGQGLTLWTGFAFGKAADVTSVAKKDVGLKPYTSANEYSYLRGLANTFNLTKSLEITTFYSFRKLDASIDMVNGRQVLTTINETGLHRTATEINNKSSLKQQIVGGIIHFQKKNFDLGAIVHYTIYDKAFITGNQPYRKYNFVGKQLTNFGLYYTYSIKNRYWYGEVSKSLFGGMAYLNGLLLSLSPQISTVILYRNYARNYHNFQSQAVAESETFNENGWYAGLNINPIKSLSFAFYTDYFSFKWLKFRINAPSKGLETLAQLAYSPKKTLKATLRFKSETKQQNSTATVAIYALDQIKKETYRLDLNWQLHRNFRIQNRLEIGQFKRESYKAEFSKLVYVDIAFAKLATKLAANLRLAYFNTPSYDSRIYAYEDDILYNFSFGMYNGKGYRTYLNLKYKIIKNLDFWARYALFYYPDATSVGSGLDELKGNKKSEVKLQVRYQF